MRRRRSTGWLPKGLLRPSRTALDFYGTVSEELQNISDQNRNSRQSAESLAGRIYAAPCRYNPTDGIACENTMRIGTKIAPLPGVIGTATSTRDPSGYSF